jgi:hypothetical protein
MNTQELKGLLKVCTQDLTEAGLALPKVPTTYRISNRMTRALGNCRIARNRFTGATTKIIISLSKDLTVELAKNTLMHEMLHAVDENRNGHGYAWQQLARLMTRRGYTIATYATHTEVVALDQIRGTKRARAR